jgi:hypothetical protein
VIAMSGFLCTPQVKTYSIFKANREGLDGQWFSYGLKLPQNLPEIDSYLYSRMRRRFSALESRRPKTKVLVDTNETKSLEIEVETKLVWPRLLSHPVVHFPLTVIHLLLVSL